MEQCEKLCPFKKRTVWLDQRTAEAKTTTYELFEPCAGERCMACVMGRGGIVRCLRLEAIRDD